MSDARGPAHRRDDAGPDGPVAPAGDGASAEQAEQGQQGGFAQAFAEQFSFEQAIGGPRGMIEAVVPMTLFSVVYGLGAEMRTAIIAAVVPAVGFAIWRLASRQPITQAVSGVLGIALGAYLAMRTGRAENFVLPSLYKNSAQAVIFGVSALTRWPLLGLIIGLLRGEGFAWRTDPALMRAYRQATWLWAGMFVFRLAVQWPLYQAHAVAALGLANVLLGLPLFGAVLWLTWAIVRKHHPGPGPGVGTAGRDGAVREGGLPIRPDASPG